MIFHPWRWMKQQILGWGTAIVWLPSSGWLQIVMDSKPKKGQKGSPEDATDCLVLFCPCWCAQVFVLPLICNLLLDKWWYQQKKKLKKKINWTWAKTPIVCWSAQCQLLFSLINNGLQYKPLIHLQNSITFPSRWSLGEHKNTPITRALLGLCGTSKDSYTEHQCSISTSANFLRAIYSFNKIWNKDVCNMLMSEWTLKGLNKML